MTVFSACFEYRLSILISELELFSLYIWMISNFSKSLDGCCGGLELSVMILTSGVFDEIRQRVLR